MIAIPIIANPWVSDLMFNQEQSLEHSDGCMTSMLAFVVPGFHQDSIVCISSDERWWDTTRGTSRGKNNYWAYFLPKSFTHQQAQQKGLSPCIVIMKWKMGRDRLRAVFTCHLSPFGQEWTRCSLRQSAPSDDISVWAPALCCRGMCCTVRVGCNLATCLLLDAERNTACFRCNRFESRPN